MKKFSIAVHGGAGTILRHEMSNEKEALYRIGLKQSIQAGATILEKGGTALDAVEAALIVLEDNPLFNAGRGSVFTHEGIIEMDASIMNGNTLEAGAVAGIRNIRNPVTLARTVMEKSVHVLMCGRGAEAFAKEHDIKTEPDDYFFTQFRYEQLQQIKDTDKVELDHSSKKPIGTAGAVAMDKKGNLAAATSTGGMTNKKYGRVGDSPIIGAGTYANNNTCAISCTGHGEFYIRAVVAYDISCLMEYKGLTLKEACDTVVMKKLKKMGGEGGLIAIDNQGNIELVFNTEGMYRASLKEGDDIFAGLYED